MKLFLFSLFFLSVFSCKNHDNPVSGEDNNLQPEEKFNYIAKGDSIVMHTFDTLRNTLLAAIRNNGFDGAVEFCNIRALPLTGTYENEHVSIKRTSNKIRNPANLPDSMEQRVLSGVLSLKDPSAATSSIVEKDPSGKVHYFKPIVMQTVCLNCHGNSTQIQPRTLEVIRLKYPGDAAIGYKEGDIRGLWHVVFNNKGPGK